MYIYRHISILLKNVMKLHFYIKTVINMIKLYPKTLEIC